jgi:hypothetical protein
MRIKNKIKHWLVLAILFTCAQVVANPYTIMRGGETGNGGDPEELYFREIAINIRQWLVSGNSMSLKLPEGLSNDTYKDKIIEVIDQFDVSFTFDLIQVAGTNKMCKNFWKSENDPKIICNYHFIDLKIEDKYKLIHHELAGLAGLEISEGGKSDYFISSQISGFLKKEIIKRLPIVPQLDKTITYFAAGTEYDFSFGGPIHSISDCDAINITNNKDIGRRQHCIAPFVVSAILSDLKAKGLFDLRNKLESSPTKTHAFMGYDLVLLAVQNQNGSTLTDDQLGIAITQYIRPLITNLGLVTLNGFEIAGISSLTQRLAHVWGEAKLNTAGNIELKIQNMYGVTYGVNIQTKCLSTKYPVLSTLEINSQDQVVSLEYNNRHLYCRKGHFTLEK